LVELANNPAVSRFLVDTFPYPYKLEDAHWWIQTGSQAGIARVIELNGNFVGSVGAVPGTGEKRKQYGIGYWLGEPYWGQGITTKALRLFSDELFQTTDVQRLQAWVYADNIASIRVLEKAGFTKDAVLRNALYKNGKLFDEGIYSRLRS
jgi:RimJ/RimL family protein N-acetyltransferase